MNLAPTAYVTPGYTATFYALVVMSHICVWG